MSILMLDMNKDQKDRYFEFHIVLLYFSILIDLNYTNAKLTFNEMFLVEFGKRGSVNRLGMSCVYSLFLTKKIQQL